MRKGKDQGQNDWQNWNNEEDSTIQMMAFLSHEDIFEP